MIHIYAVGPDGKFRKDVPIRELVRLLNDDDARTWVDFRKASDLEHELLATMFGLHPLSVEDCIEDVHHPKFEDYGDYIFVITHAILRRDGTVSTHEVDTFLGHNFLITYRKVPIPAIDDVLAQPDRAQDLVTRGLDYVLYALCDNIANGYFPVLDDIEATIDQVEEDLFEKHTATDLTRILGVKRSLLHIRRVAAPQREIFNNLSRGHGKFVDREAALHFRDVFDAFFRVIDQTDMLKDLVNGVMDTHLTVSSHKLNEIMKFLTILSTTMMAPTLIAGVYGMNFEYMPELKWGMGYGWALGLMLAVVVGILGMFRYKRWL